MKRVLIIGNLYALAKKMSEIAEKVYVTSVNPKMTDFAEIVDIREDKPFELLDFAVKNDVDLTIVVSEKAILSDISSIFQENNKAIFAPAINSAENILNRTANKKLLYKLHIPTPKFASFDKLSLATEYLENANYPLVITSNNISDVGTCHSTIKYAKYALEDLFTKSESRVVIEEYIHGHEFSMYAITDGYQTIPLATLKKFRFSESGDGGKLTNGMGCYLPDNVIPQEIQNEIFNNVIVKTVSNFQQKNIPYLGIIGVDGVFCQDNSYQILNLKSFFNNIEAQAIINSVEDNWYELFHSCANGFFADEYEDIITNDKVYISCLIQSKLEGQQIDNTELLNNCEISYLNVKKLDEKICTIKGDNFVLTSNAKTLSRAKQNLADDIDLIKFDGINYRKDIL